MTRQVLTLSDFFSLSLPGSCSASVTLVFNLFTSSASGPLPQLSLLPGMCRDVFDSWPLFVTQVSVQLSVLRESFPCHSAPERPLVTSNLPQLPHLSTLNILSPSLECSSVVKGPYLCCPALHSQCDKCLMTSWSWNLNTGLAD